MSDARIVRMIVAAGIFSVMSVIAPVSHADETLHEIAQRDLFYSLERACLIEPGEPFQIVAPLDGRLERLMQEGQSVAEGDILAAYDSAPLERDLGLARSR